MSFYTNTDTGKVRLKNEDAYINHTDINYTLHIVADGMGGHNAGEVASSLSVKYISQYIIDNFGDYDIDKLIYDGVDNAHKKVYKLSKEKREYRGMGTTVIISIIYKDILYFANIGDSRIYLYSDDRLDQITKDHSYVQELLDSGAITEEDAKFYPRNQITSALGTSLKYKIDLDTINLKKGDRILMTTDGLTDLIDDNDILDVLQMNYTLKDTTEILTYMANSTGGRDNITITCVEVD